AENGFHFDVFPAPENILVFRTVFVTPFDKVICAARRVFLHNAIQNIKFDLGQALVSGWASERQFVAFARCDVFGPTSGISLADEVHHLAHSGPEAHGIIVSAEDGDTTSDD